MSDHDNIYERDGDSLTRRISRRQALKAGSLTALGLVFTTPRIDTIQPKPMFQAVSPVAPPKPTQPCLAIIDTVASGISGPGIAGNAVASGSTSQYSANVVSDCGSCNEGSCAPSVQYQWAAIATNALTVQIDNLNSASTTVTPNLSLSNAGFGFAQYELQVTITLTCGTGNCLSTTQAVLTATVSVFA